MGGVLLVLYVLVLIFLVIFLVHYLKLIEDIKNDFA